MGISLNGSLTDVKTTGFIEQPKTSLQDIAPKDIQIPIGKSESPKSSGYINTEIDMSMVDSSSFSTTRVGTKIGNLDVSAGAVQKTDDAGNMSNGVRLQADYNQPLNKNFSIGARLRETFIPDNNTNSGQAKLFPLKFSTKTPIDGLSLYANANVAANHNFNTGKNTFTAGGVAGAAYTLDTGTKFYTELQSDVPLDSKGSTRDILKKNTTVNVGVNVPF